MTVQQIVRDLNTEFKEDSKLVYKLEKKINELEKIITNLTERLEYLESHQCQ